LKVLVRMFAAYREMAGISEIEIDMPACSTVKDLVENIGGRYTGLPSKEYMVVAVNYQYAEHDLSLSDGDEVAFIPPVSGG